MTKGARPPGTGTGLQDQKKSTHALSCPFNTEVLRYIDMHMAKPQKLPLGKVVASIVETVIRDDARAHGITIHGVTDVR